jgi:hypothetical protein
MGPQNEHLPPSPAFAPFYCIIKEYQRLSIIGGMVQLIRHVGSVDGMFGGSPGGKAELSE